MKRVRTVKQTIQSREEMELLVGDIAELVISQDAVKAELDGRLLEIRAQYEARLTELNEAIAEKLPIAQDWAERNPDAFGAKKSIEMVHAVVGFRTGTPKLKTLSGWTWDLVRERIAKLAMPYLRTTVEVDKERIIAERAELADDGLKKLGVKVAQDESFFIEPKQETVGA